MMAVLKMKEGLYDGGNYESRSYPNKVKLNNKIMNS
jgi:hypothetical protein